MQVFFINVIFGKINLISMKPIFSYTLVTIASILFSSIRGLCQTSPDYDSFFTGERLRIDLVLAGDANHQYAYL